MVSSKGASTSSRTHNGDGFVRNTANRSEIAVRAFSPPESKESVCNFFPGGFAIISRPELRGSLGSVNSSFASPPENNCLNIF